MITAEDLRNIPSLREVPTAELEWFAAQSRERQLATGEVLYRQGEPAQTLILILSGTLQTVREEEKREVSTLVLSGGEITGKLPFSRMKVQGATFSALSPTRIAEMSESCFGAMRSYAPTLEQNLVNVMLDRTKEFTRLNEQREKLAALGKLSAGLAHELNNPAAAAQRAAGQLLDNLSSMQQCSLKLAKEGLSDSQIDALLNFGKSLRVLKAPSLSAIEQSDLEDGLSDWLDERDIDRAWEIASVFVQAGLTLEQLEAIERFTEGKALPAVFTWLESSLNVYGLVSDIEESSRRIAELVKAVKTYTHMDQAPLQELDIHNGINSTLAILGHRLKDITVHRMYGKIPKIQAYGGELNQVWTNLIVNAIDAMNGQGQLWLHTNVDGDRVVIEIGDDGPGIPEDIKGRIFEPFFTTKGVGEGSGLGLDIVHRIIVKRHNGTISVNSTPGDTCFTIRLPLQLEGKAAT